MKNMIRNLTLSVGLLVLAGCGGHEPETKRTAGAVLPAVRVEAVAAERTREPSLTEVSGLVRAAQRASIAPKVMGTIVEMPVVLGQLVEEGALLARIQAMEIDARVAQAEVQLRQAERDAQREQALLGKGASTEEMVRNLQDRVSIATSMLNEARTMLGYTELRAPFAGTVAQKMRDVGSLAAPGMPLMTLESADAFEIEANVPESLASGLKVGGVFRATLPTSGGVVEVTLSEVSSSYDSNTRSVAARFALPEKTEARAGQFARVGVPGVAIDRILVPEEAVSRKGQLDRVFVVEGGRALLRLVKVGASSGGRIELLSGVDAGEIVVVSSASGLRDGQGVEVAR